MSAYDPFVRGPFPVGVRTAQVEHGARRLPVEVWYPATDEYAGLDCVQIQLAPEEVTFVATDRYRLAVRTVRPVEFGGTAARVLVRADELAAVSRWAAAGDAVRVEVNGGLVLVRGDESRSLTAVEAEYPAYEQILDGLTPPVCRVVVDRAALLAALAGRDVVTVDLDQESLRIGDEVKLEAIGSGAVRVGFTASLLAAALETSVGPDVLLEICEPARPVVVRSADHRTFTTPVMPVRLHGRTGRTTAGWQVPPSRSSVTRRCSSRSDGPRRGSARTSPPWC